MEKASSRGRKERNVKLIVPSGTRKARWEQFLDSSRVRFVVADVVS